MFSEHRAVEVAEDNTYSRGTMQLKLGNRTLVYITSDSEFAGGNKAGQAGSLGRFYITDNGKPETWPGSDEVRSYTIYQQWEYNDTIELFAKGHV